MPSGPSQHSWVQWPFSVSKVTVSGTSGGLCFRSSHESAQLVDRGGLLALELGTRFDLLEQFRVLTHLVACMECVAPFWSELLSVPGRHARLSSLQLWLRRNSWACLLLQRASSPVLGSCWSADGLHWTQAARAARRWLRRRQCFASVSRWEACGVSHDPSCS